MKIDIEALARQAGGYESPAYPGNLVMDLHDLDRFAQLVAVLVKGQCADLAEYWEKARSYREQASPSEQWRSRHEQPQSH